jgi:hypothetical protein
VGGFDLVGTNGITSPTPTQNDLALVDFAGGESSTPPNVESLALTDGGNDVSGGECESLALLNEGSIGTNGGVVEGSEVLEPIRVEPLAIIAPHGMEGSGSEIGGSLGRKPSNWVMRKEKGIGKVLGASYERYEQAVIELLMEIEAKHIERKAAMVGIRKPISSGNKCSRELKRLVSSINYEARHSKEAKGKGKIPGGGGYCGGLMSLKILTWNVRGLNNRDKRLRLKNMIKDWHADIICLQETKLEFIMAQIVRSLRQCQFVD